MFCTTLRWYGSRLLQCFWRTSPVFFSFTVFLLLQQNKKVSAGLRHAKTSGSLYTWFTMLRFKDFGIEKGYGEPKGNLLG